MSLFNFFRNPNIQLTDDQRFLNIEYKPRSAKPLYDICDEHGRIIKTGKITRNQMKLAVGDLINAAYVLLILDGDQIKKHRFEISR
tara:strand:+ start:227 stop:484 length:258 start_codon:yes stop_codon:yes gene_type:complete